MKKVFSILGGVLLAASSSAYAQQATSAPAAKPVKSNDPVTCRTDNVLGSRIQTRKVCMKQSEWRQLSQESGDWAEHKETYLGKPGGG